MMEEIKAKVAEVRKVLEDGGIHAYVEQYSDLPCISVAIQWGDWKHDHARAKWLIEERVKGVSFGLTTVTDEDGSDCYSATHFFLV